MDTITSSANRQIARAAGTVMVAFVLSNLTGLIRQVLVSRAFGTGAQIDAFNAAARLPDLLFSLDPYIYWFHKPGKTSDRVEIGLLDCQSNRYCPHNNQRSRDVVGSTNCTGCAIRTGS